jgi:hypothetical protein
MRFLARAEVDLAVRGDALAVEQLLDHSFWSAGSSTC